VVVALAVMLLEPRAVSGLPQVLPELLKLGLLEAVVKELPHQKMVQPILDKAELHLILDLLVRVDLEELQCELRYDMAHVARIDSENMVVEVHVINNEDLPNNGAFLPETEAFANDFQHSLGLNGNWLLTSYNNNFRGRFAGPGYKYDPELDEFIMPETFSILDQ
jgi:hypothetical protein